MEHSPRVGAPGIVESSELPLERHAPSFPPDSAVPRCNVDLALAAWQAEGHQ